MDKEKKIANFSGKGEIYSFTIDYTELQGFESPRHIALIRLEEGPLVTAQLTDLGDTPIEIGMPVEMVTRKLRTLNAPDTDRGMILYGYKFRPVLRKST